MQGQMMDYQLTITPLLERARRLFPKKEIVTKAGPGLERFTYEQMTERVGRLANALSRLGVKSGDRVATFAWNNARHLEIYFAVPCMGAVLHPLNLRLPADQLTYIIAHADDQVLFIDPSLLPAIEKLAPQIKNIKHYIIMGDKVPEGTTLSPVHAYEDLLNSARSRGCKFGPGKTSFVPSMTVANGVPHASTWNMGTTGIKTSRSERPNESVMLKPNAWR